MTHPAPRSYPPKPEAVYFYGTCLVDMLFPQAGLAAVELIEREGVRVIFPQGQSCCGQPAFNSGYRREARAVARAQLALFAKPLPVVVPSGSCGAMLHAHYPELFRGEPEQAAAEDLAARIFEWSDFMVNVLRVRLEDRGPPVRVAYHPSCHLLREMGVRDAPRQLLGALEHVEVLPVADAEECCGFGGTFAVKMPGLSEAMVADKSRAVRESGADVLVSMDGGCLMNIGGALARSGAPTRCVPLPQFIAERTGGGGHAA
ncbi:MAG TPA: (Fe-S)-binding protein [bacterium]|nr:(Fe-S)-binding protein [bacterium]